MFIGRQALLMADWMHADRIELLRDLQAFFGLTFKITADAGAGDDAPATVLLSCMGVGYGNMAKKVT
jgi:hypothetical protein